MNKNHKIITVYDGQNEFIDFVNFSLETLKKKNNNKLD